MRHSGHCRACEQVLLDRLYAIIEDNIGRSLAPEVLDKVTLCIRHSIEMFFQQISYAPQPWGVSVVSEGARMRVKFQCDDVDLAIFTKIAALFEGLTRFAVL